MVTLGSFHSITVFHIMANQAKKKISNFCAFNDNVSFWLTLFSASLVISKFLGSVLFMALGGKTIRLFRIHTNEKYFRYQNFIESK